MPHLLDQGVRDQARCPCPDDEHGPDHDVGLQADLLDGVLGGGDRLEGATEVVVHLAQTVKIAVEHEDLRVHADSHGGRGEAGHAGTEDDDAGGAHAGDAAHQDSPAAAGPHQMMGPHQRRHPPGHLAHGGEERQRVVLLAHRLVGDCHVAGGDERVGALT
jgi:hypothetical protein